MTSSSIGLVQFAGEGVLLAHVVAAEQLHGVAAGRDQGCLRGVAEPRLGGGHHPAKAACTGQRGVPADAAEGEYRAQAGGGEGQVSVEPVPAGLPLCRGGLVGRGCAANRRDDAHAREGQAVAAGDAARLVRVARAMQGGVDPVAAAVAGEHPARAIGSVRGGGEPDDEDVRMRVTEAGARPAPVRLGGEGCPLSFTRHALPPSDQPRAGTAHRHPGIELGGICRGGRQPTYLGRGRRDRRRVRRRIARPTGTRRHRRGEQLTGHRVRELHRLSSKLGRVSGLSAAGRNAASPRRPRDR